MAHGCVVCKNVVEDSDRVVLVRGRRRQVFCSGSCLHHTVRKQRAARTSAQLRWTLRLSLSLLALIGVATLWLRHRVPRPQAISFPWSMEEGPDARPAGPTLIGPPWPPTDEQWIALFNSVGWVDPLPGPNRRAPTASAQLLGPADPREPQPLCREDGRCGAGLGGELWGEQVYAAQDGIVDRVQEGGPNQPGGISVRLAHFGGMVFTQYFHLAATPRRVKRGAQVKAGEVIGLVGDTGAAEGTPRLHFTLSVRPSRAFAEVYWDPTPWLARSRLRVPPHGSVAGFMSDRDRALLPRWPR